MTGYGEAAYRAAADFEQAMARLRQAVLAAAQASPYSATQLVDRLCDGLASGSAGAVAAFTQDTIRAQVAAEIATAIAKAPPFADLLIEASDWWRGYRTACLNAADIARKHATTT